MERRVAVQGGYLWAGDRAGDNTCNDGPANDGPVIAMLHPGWGDSSIWLPVMERLPARYRLIRYDTRGYGRSPAAAAEFTQAGDLTTVLDDLGADRVVVVGHSGGGATAISFALACPARTRALLLLAPGVQDYPWPPDDPFGTQGGVLHRAGDRDGLTELGLRTHAPADPGPAARAQIRGAVDAFFDGGLDFERPDPPAYSRLEEISAPSAVVLGDLEYPMVARCATEVASRIPGCRLIPAPGADHMLPLRVPALIADLTVKLARDG
jgi:pimeloyl-ACP methyl ester carboxylesterase